MTKIQDESIIDENQLVEVLQEDDPCQKELMLDPRQEYELADLWNKRLKEAQKIYQPYYDEIKKARSFYKSGLSHSSALFSLSEMQNVGGNIFWSGIETQKPFLYFKTPKPYLERLRKTTSKVNSVATKILERALEWNLTQFDFDSVIKYARNDYLISGCGILWEQYVPEFQMVRVPFASNEIELKTSEKVISKYVDPLDFLMDTTNTGIFEEVTWVARLIHMKASELRDIFSKKVWDMIEQSSFENKEERVFDVYEIWDKETKRVYWYSFDFPTAFLKVTDDPLHLSGFFPIAKPIFATMTNDSLIPVSDFQMIEKMLEEFKGVTHRMRLVMQAIKVSGVYDASFSRMNDIFDKDVTLLALHDFERLKEAGGIQGVIDFIPIHQYITSLEVLAKRRDALKEEIFEITGVSDIMRGNSTKIETATAVEKKTNFGTLRNQDRQNDMQRFITECYRIKAELICEQFSSETLKSFISTEEGYSEEVIKEAILLLKNNKLRDMILHIETEAFFNQENYSKKMLEAIDILTKTLINGVSVVSTEPLLLPIYRQMIQSVSTVFPQARQFEQVIDTTFSQIEENIVKEKQRQALRVLNTQSQSVNNYTQELIKLKLNLEKQGLLFKLKELFFKEKELCFKNKRAEIDFKKALIKHQPETDEVQNISKDEEILPVLNDRVPSFLGRIKSRIPFLKKDVS